jgi:hypothetical protein
MSQFGPSQKKVEIIEDSIETLNAFSFGPGILVRRVGLWAKHMGSKQGAIGNTLGSPLPPNMFQNVCHHFWPGLIPPL